MYFGKDEPKFVLFMRDRDGRDRAFPVSMAALCGMIKELNNWLSIFGTMKSGEPATVLLHHPSAAPAPAKLIHISQQTGRSTYDNPLGK